MSKYKPLSHGTSVESYLRVKQLTFNHNFEQDRRTITIRGARVYYDDNDVMNFKEEELPIDITLDATYSSRVINILDMDANDSDTGETITGEKLRNALYSLFRPYAIERDTQTVTATIQAGSPSLESISSLVHKPTVEVVASDANITTEISSHSNFDVSAALVDGFGYSTVTATVNRAQSSDGQLTSTEATVSGNGYRDRDGN